MNFFYTWTRKTIHIKEKTLEPANRKHAETSLAISKAFYILCTVGIQHILKRKKFNFTKPNSCLQFNSISFFLTYTFLETKQAVTTHHMFNMHVHKKQWKLSLDIVNQRFFVINIIFVIARSLALFQLSIILPLHHLHALISHEYWLVAACIDDGGAILLIDSILRTHYMSIFFSFVGGGHQNTKEPLLSLFFCLFFFFFGNTLFKLNFINYTTWLLTIGLSNMFIFYW